MGSHVGGANHSLARWHRRAHDGIDEDPLALQARGHPENRDVFAHRDGNDRGFRVPGIEAEPLELALHVARGLPELLPALGLRFDDFDGLDRRRRGSRRHGGGENARTRVVADEFHHFETRGDEPAHGGEGFREGSHHEIDLVLEAKMLGGAAPVFSEHPNPVGVVDEEASAVGVLQLDDPGQIGNVALHGENAVDHDHLAPVLGGPGEFSFEVAHVIVLVFHGLSEAQADTVDDRGVIHVVEEGQILAADQAGQDAEIDLETRCEGERGFDVHEGGEPLFELDMDIESAVEQPGARAAGSVTEDRRRRGFLDGGVAGQPQVIIRPEHDDLLAVHRDHGILGRGDAAVVRVHIRLAKLAVQRVVRALLQDIHGLGSPLSFTLFALRGAGSLLRALRAAPLSPWVASCPLRRGRASCLSSRGSVEPWLMMGPGDGCPPPAVRVPRLPQPIWLRHAFFSLRAPIGFARVILAPLVRWALSLAPGLL